MLGRIRGAARNPPAVGKFTRKGPFTEPLEASDALRKTLPSSWESLQRLYSTFANGWPGRGLLLLRLSLCAFLVARCFAETWPSTIAAVAGASLMAGLGTPISSAIAASLEICIAIGTDDARTAHLLAAAIAAALAVLGPGAYSVDARLFGRRRILIADRHDGKHS